MMKETVGSCKRPENPGAGGKEDEPCQKALGLIFQFDTKKLRTETENFRRRGREMCTETDYLGKHRIL